MIQLQPITWDNFWQTIKLKPKPDQEKYVQPVSLFMAQSYVNLKEAYPDTSLAIYDNNSLIGFTKIVFLPKDTKPYYLKKDAYMIDALIIDQSYQNQGYGKKAMDKIIDYCQSYPFGKVDELTLVCYDDNKKAQSLFAEFAFKKMRQTSKDKKMSLYSRHL
ncbi:MAG: GNAT family N-acetyltransferase [Candidatus Izemoplasmatales bacterium]